MITAVAGMVLMGQTKVILPAADVIWRGQLKVEAAMRSAFGKSPEWLKIEGRPGVLAAFESMEIPGRSPEMMDVMVVLDSKTRRGKEIQLKISGGLGWVVPFEMLGIETLGVERKVGTVSALERRQGWSATDFWGIPGLPSGTRARMMESSRVDEGDNRTVFTLRGP